MPTKNPPITGAAQPVSNERVRELFKGRPEPGARPQNERKNVRTAKPKAEIEEVAPRVADAPKGDEEEGEG